jgi:hypothetical protein
LASVLGKFADGHNTVHSSKQLLLLTYNSNFYLLLLSSLSSLLFLLFLLAVVVVIVIAVAAVLVSLAEYLVKCIYISGGRTFLKGITVAVSIIIGIV